VKCYPKRLLHFIQRWNIPGWIVRRWKPLEANRPGVKATWG